MLHSVSCMGVWGAQERVRWAICGSVRSEGFEVHTMVMIRIHPKFACVAIDVDETSWRANYRQK